MANPPTSNSPLTPKLPKLSIFPNPFGNLSLGFLNANATVLSVRKSEIKSVREWYASATRACELK